MALGFRVGRGVRLYTGGRGIAASVGTGRVRYYRHLGSIGSPRSGRRPASVATHRRDARAAARAEELERVTELDRRLAELRAAHHERIEPAARQVADPPEPVDARELERELAREATAGIRWWKLGERRAARRAVGERLGEAVATATEVRSREAAELQAALDAEWEALRANDADVVLPALEAAFEDNQAPAAAVSCTGDRADVVLRWPPVEEVVPERRPATTPTGRPTAHKRTKTERATLYLDALASHALATAKEGLATCPGIGEVGIAAVREATDPARGDDVLEPLLLATLRRAELRRIRGWKRTIATATLCETATGRIGLRGRGRSKALHALEPADPEEREFIARVARDLDLRPADGGIGGLELPVEVEVSFG